MPMDIHVGDVLTMKKAHPCGEKRWQVLRVGADFKSEIEAKLQALKTALTGTDTAAIKNATKELTDVFGKMYEAAQAAQAAQGGAGFDPNAQAGGNAGGQDYYDADYTVVDDDDKK